MPAPASLAERVGRLSQTTPSDLLEHFLEWVGELGLFFPLALVLMGAAIIRLGSRAAGALVLVAGVLWPVAHIANVETLAVAVNVLLVLGFGSLAWRTPTPGSMSQGSPSSMHST